jgi:hypothetical protein
MPTTQDAPITMNVRRSRRLPAAALALAAATAMAMLGGPGCATIAGRATPAAGATPPGAPVALGTLARAQEAHDRARADERRDDPACVDGYYRGAVLAAAAVWDGPAGGLDPASPLGRVAIALYNEALADCLRVAPEYGRLDPRDRLLIGDANAAGAIAVPVEHQGFLWAAHDFDLLVDAGAVKHSGGLRRLHARPGVGAPQIVVRLADRSPRDAWLLKRHPFPATAVLDPDFDAWLGRRAGPPRDRLRLVDPLHSQTATVAGRALPLAINLDAPVDLLGEMVDGTNYRFVALLRPEKALDIAGLYMLQPYEPGKIPVVLVHGLASSPLTWNDLIGDLRSDPAFRERYQLWLFTYPTGVGFLRNAALLREQLTAIQDELDPDGTRPQVRRAVLIGHSMGGLISKLQVTSSGDAIWDTYATRPASTLVAAPEVHDQVRRLFSFAPQPGVGRVVYVAVPHFGSNIANELPGRISSALIRPLTDAKDLMDTINRDNPGLLRPEFRQVQTGVDMLKRDHPLLLTMARLPVAPAVTTHSIIGIGTRSFDRVRGDTVVPIESARIPGVASEVFVPENHSGVHHNERSTAEILRILDEHWRETHGGTLALATAPRDDATRPVSFAPGPRSAGPTRRPLATPRIATPNP